MSSNKRALLDSILRPCGATLERAQSTSAQAPAEAADDPDRRGIARPAAPELGAVSVPDADARGVAADGRRDRDVVDPVAVEVPCRERRGRREPSVRSVERLRLADALGSTARRRKRARRR